MPVQPVIIKGSKILVTGPTGQVAGPVIDAWAGEAEIVALARFSGRAQCELLEAAGVQCLQADLAHPDALQELTGFEPVFRESAQAFGSLAIDTTRRHQAIGPTRVPWREGIVRMVPAMAPGLLKPGHG